MADSAQSVSQKLKIATVLHNFSEKHLAIFQYSFARTALWIGAAGPEAPTKNRQQEFRKSASL
ncbi:MAG: hypothetical protein AAGD09_10770 [Cyanobacteria bacterium P01_F01_bin.56]